MRCSPALMFPGQGSQFVGMGRELYAARPECRERFDRASAILGWDLARVCFEGPEEDLTRSDRAQPAIFTLSLACVDALRREAPGIRWAAAAGLSSGEWAALAAAGVLGFEDAIRALHVRGRAMQEACEQMPGGMLCVIGLEPDALEEVCRRSGAAPANYNSPEQVVLTGSLEQIAAAEAAAAGLGARRTVRLAVAGAFHGPRMRPAAARLEQALRETAFAEPAFPVYSNVTGAPHTGAGAIRDAMVAQVVSPVQWVGCVRGLRAAGVTDFVECGPGRVLSGLVRRIDKQAAIHTIQDPAGLETAVSVLSGN